MEQERVEGIRQPTLLTDPIIRVKAALADRPRGHRGPQAEQLHVRLKAGDLATLCDAVTDHDDVTLSLQRGAKANRPQADVIVQADDAYHVLDKVGE